MVKHLKFKLISIFAFTIIISHADAQIEDGFGVMIGQTYSNQYNEFNGLDFAAFDHSFKIGLKASAYIERKLGNRLSVRSEIGYIEKGFKLNDQVLRRNGGAFGIRNDRVIFHNLAFDIGLKMKIFKNEKAPYIFTGIRVDYLFSYRDVELVFVPGPEEPIGLFGFEIDQNDKQSYGGLFGIGFDSRGQYFFELVYNPNLAKSQNQEGFSTKDVAWVAKVGFNLKKLFGKQEEVKQDPID